MRRIVSCALAAIILCLSYPLSSCRDNDAGDAYITFTDSLSNTVSLSEPPTRVAVLFSSFAQMWLLAGGEVSITVGESVERGFVDNSALLVDTGAGKHISTEQLVAYAPDFVIYSADIPAQVNAAGTLSKIGIPSAGFRVEEFSDFLSVFEIMTDITGNSDAYSKYGTEQQKNIENLISNVGAQEEKSILFIRAGTSAKATKAKNTESHFVARMLSELGCRNIADDAPILLDGLSVEVIIKENPDVIFISSMGDEAAVREYMTALLSTDLWQNLDAVKDDRCFFLPKDKFHFKPNGDWYNAYVMLWEIIYES